MASTRSYYKDSSIHLTPTMAFINFLLSCLIFFVSHPIFSNAQDSLAQGQSISDDGQALVSAGGVFELGFFSPGNSTSRYVGIWYRNITQQSVVWVANREAPLADHSGSLAIGLDGNLVVLDGAGMVVWSTNRSTGPNNNSTAQLLDSGNLVVGSSNGSILWESFDHKTDTFIPGMKVVLDRKTGKNQLLTSWKSPNDPSIGNYTLGLDPSGSGQIFIWEGTLLRWRSGQWNKETFIGTMMRPLYIYGFTLTNDVNHGLMYFTFSAFNSTLLRFVLQWDGVENTSMLNEENKEWESVWVQPLNECEFYGKCGDYGLCTYSGEATCSCLKGFEPKLGEEWNRGNWSGGCVRSTPLQCQLNASITSKSGQGDGFFSLEGVKLPDVSDWATTVGNEADCRSACSSNCSCKAYAYPSGIGCLIWGRDLVDIYQFPSGGSVLYIKLAGSELGTNRKTWIIIVIPSALGMTALIICIFLWWRYNEIIKNWWKKGGKQESLNSSFPVRQEAKPDMSGPSECGEEGKEGNGLELPLFSFDCLSTATSNFSDSNKLGQGGFGHVYKGVLPGGQEIAVKRLSTSSGQGLEEFKNEVILIAKLQHRNLVRQLGCCIQGEEKILIYEYMPNKSLDAFLFEPTKKSSLDWKRRFNIIEGIARGLLYLHRDSRLRIVHRDLKASNILLDEQMNPKISDFGIARIFGGDQNQANTNRVVGTYGYMSPEYAMEGHFSVKSDVYSFGILILEIVTGRRNNSFHGIQNSLNIVGYAWQLWNEDNAMELIDPSIKGSSSSHEVLRCIHLALLCVQDRPNERPDMSTVVLMLGSETTTLPMPKQPKFTVPESPNETMVVANRNECFSTNDVTITMLRGR